nr:ATP-binding protein [uncultured Acetobacterium sp.]
MLVQFSVKNFLSFKNESVLDLTAISAYKEHEYNLIDLNIKEKYLKVAAIYGANASGKSNLFLAFHCFQKMIIETFNNVSNDDLKIIKICYSPFLFDEDEENAEFEIVEILDGYEYRYGFEYNDQKIVAEWLYRKNLKTNRKTIVFERDDCGKIFFGASVRKECETYKEQIPPETLVLSFFNKLKLKTDIFYSVYRGIMDTLVLDTDFYEDWEVVEKFLPQVIDNNKESLLEFLEAIDSGIKDIWHRKEEKEEQFFTVHKDMKGNDYDLALLNESEGTIKSIIIFLYAKLAVQHDKSMFIDELNVKLHPLLLKFIIDLFYEKSSNAQLIYTTHDTTLLDKKFFRRDQIWFVQKDDTGHSELNALSDFKVRSDASFEKDYLSGVYGGVPLLKDFNLKEGE